jgi:hypothetical protein
MLRWGVALGVSLAGLGLSSGAALADGWRHDGPPHGERHWHRPPGWERHYVPPPVVYAPPPRAYYVPPPVVYAPPPVVYAPQPSGLSIVVPLNIR